MPHQQKLNEQQWRISLAISKKNKKEYSARNNWKSFAQMRNGPPDNYCTPPWFAGARLEICQKIYTTGFSGQKFYTLNVRKFRLFLLKKKQRKCINLAVFLLNECVNL